MLDFCSCYPKLNTPIFVRLRAAFLSVDLVHKKALNRNSLPAAQPPGASPPKGIIILLKRKSSKQFKNGFFWDYNSPSLFVVMEHRGHHSKS